MFWLLTRQLLPERIEKIVFWEQKTWINPNPKQFGIDGFIWRQGFAKDKCYWSLCFSPQGCFFIKDFRWAYICVSPLPFTCKNPHLCFPSVYWFDCTAGPGQSWPQQNLFSTAGGSIHRHHYKTKKIINPHLAESFCGSEHCHPKVLLTHKANEGIEKICRLEKILPSAITFCSWACLSEELFITVFFQHVPWICSVCFFAPSDSSAGT